MKKLVSIPEIKPAHASKLVLGATKDRPASFSSFTESHEVREGPQHLQQAAGHRGHRPHAGLHSVHEVRQEGGGHQIRPLHLQKGPGGPPHAPPRLRVSSSDGVLLQQGACTSICSRTPSRGLSSSQLCLPHRINQWPLRSLNWV